MEISEAQLFYGEIEAGGGKFSGNETFLIGKVESLRAN